MMNNRRDFYVFVFSLLVSLVPVFSMAQSDIERQAKTSFPSNLPKTPPSPVFFLMGIEPVCVDRPTTPKDLLGSLILNLSDLAENPEGYVGLNLEFNPYWIIKNSKDSDHKSLGSYESNNNPLFSSWQTLSASLALVPSKKIGPNSGIMSSGIGLRFSPFPGELNSSYKENLFRLVEEFEIPYETELRSRFNRDAQYTELVKIREIESGDALDTLSRRDIDFKLTRRENDILREFGSEFASRKIYQRDRIDLFTLRTPQKRVKFKLEVASATTFDLNYSWLENEVDSSQHKINIDSISPLNKFGAWLTTGFEGKKAGIFVTGRFVDYSLLSDSNNLRLDGALRLAFDLSNHFSLSGEGMYSHFPKGDTSHVYRLDGIFDFNYPRISGSIIAGWDSHKGIFFTFIGDGELIKSLRPSL